MKIQINNKLNRASATWYPGIQSILIEDFQRKSQTEEDCLKETLGVL